jgi:hypothetical protein
MAHSITKEYKRYFHGSRVMIPLSKICLAENYGRNFEEGKDF